MKITEAYIDSSPLLMGTNSYSGVVGTRLFKIHNDEGRWLSIPAGYYPVTIYPRIGNAYDLFRLLGRQQTPFLLSGQCVCYAFFSSL